MKRSIELKIKVCNLADEARTIRREERKLAGMEKWALQHHRKTVVRDAARRSQCAYLFIWGKDWPVHEKPGDWPAVQKMIRKYGDDESIERLEARKAA